ncbi:MAG TPA: hypothetical protein GX529_04045, partial [Firmicutes bacterium]|nr:hypothetical protein [Candidatus Fermentithermobacillaceae bacterium]
VPTLFGDVTFKRRYYEDVETKDYVHLLDEVLGVKAGQASRVWPLLQLFKQ